MKEGIYLTTNNNYITISLQMDGSHILDFGNDLQMIYHSHEELPKFLRDSEYLGKL